MSVTSASNQAASGPQLAATSASSSGSSPTSATRAPSAESLRAHSAPIPRAAPVIRTVRPERFQVVATAPAYSYTTSRGGGRSASTWRGVIRPVSSS